MTTHKERRFTVFGIGSARLGETTAETRELGLALFATGEPIHLWLKRQKLKAPFTRLFVNFEDEKSYKHAHGKVLIGEGECTVIEAVSVPLLLSHASDRVWVISKISHALQCVVAQVGWRSTEFEAMLAELAEKPWPIVHYFNQLETRDSRSGVRVLPWISFRPGLTQIGVRISRIDDPPCDVEIVSKHWALHWEDFFPLAKCKIDSGHVLLLDKDGKTLATVPLTKDALH